MRIAFLSTIDGKLDEGMKNVASNILKDIRFNQIETKVYSKKTIYNPLNFIKMCRCDFIFLCYTLNRKTMFLSKLIRLFNKNIVLLVVQPFSEFINIDCVKRIFKFFVTINKGYLLKLGMKDNNIFNYHFCIDKNKFIPKDSLIRNNDKPTILSVGHLTEGRMIDSIIKINLPVNKIVVTSIDENDYLKKLLVNNNVFVLDKYITHIEDIYRSADLYFFPTISAKYVIFIPLSVLEAASCGLPILINENFECIDLIKEYVINSCLFTFNDNNINDVIVEALEYSKTHKGSFLNESIRDSGINNFLLRLKNE